MSPSITAPIFRLRVLGSIALGAARVPRPFSFRPVRWLLQLLTLAGILEHLEHEAYIVSFVGPPVYSAQLRDPPDAILHGYHEWAAVFWRMLTLSMPPT
ncbi:hypothetical protein C8Q76DRAFT_802755 [Earliella scabrosa]|nr:hypothetical protein C8Q76DRAFT_802755 [Earliella scabrosa]